MRSGRTIRVLIAALTVTAAAAVAALNLMAGSLRGAGAPVGAARGAAASGGPAAWSRRTVGMRDDAYTLAYTFKNHRNTLESWSWTMDRNAADGLTARFGMPSTFFQPYAKSGDVLQERKRLMEDGLFREMDGNRVNPDMNALVNASYRLLDPLYALLEQDTARYGLDRRGRIELLMRFCQDIPYGIPPDVEGDRVISGVFPPPRCLLEGYGDCDTKALLFAGVLSHDPAFEILFLEVPGHMLVGIQGVPRAYEASATWRGRQFVMCEPVGPGRLPFGKAANAYSTIVSVQPVTVPEATRGAPGPAAGAALKTEALGNSFSFRPLLDGKPLPAGKGDLWVNTEGTNSYYAAMEGMPDDRGVWSFGTEARTVYLLLQKPGYYIRTAVAMPEGRNVLDVDLPLDEGGCLFVRTAPGAAVNVFRRQADGTWFGWAYQADDRGDIRILCDPGQYDISRTRALSGKPVYVDWRQGIAATVER